MKIKANKIANCVGNPRPYSGRGDWDWRAEAAFDRDAVAGRVRSKKVAGSFFPVGRSAKKKLEIASLNAVSFRVSKRLAN